jgi:hypothetical protein
VQDRPTRNMPRQTAVFRANCDLVDYTKPNKAKKIILSPEIKLGYDQVDRLLETDNSLVSDS